jgi:hypothetical protein
VTTYPPQGPALPSPDPSPVPPGRGRTPWRPAVVGATALGTPAAVSILHPVLGEAIPIIEVAGMLTVIAVALFGSQALSERAFRLLRWLGNRPEPPGPGAT